MCLFSIPFLLLLLCGAQASHFYGTVIAFDPKDTHPNGAVSVVLRYKTGFHSCTDALWVCNSGSCGSQTALEENTVQENTVEQWCQREGIMSRLLSSNAPFQLKLEGGNWISNPVNNIRSWKAVTLVDLRTRSDTGKANRSPQTTIIPSLRVPSNCVRNFNLLAFDPDGDQVKCRVGTGSECNPCTPPSVLSISTSCTLSYAAPSGAVNGPYIVQIYMEDFPNQSITLTQTDGSQTSRTTSNALSKIPLQFVVRVDGAVASCTEGQYLPRFLSPTPANRAQLYAFVGQTLEITVNPTATISTVSNLWFSGPHNMNLTGSGQGPFTLRWTPLQSEDGEHHPVCFVSQATLSTTKYDSELRCVIVSVSNEPTTTTTEPTTTTTVPTTTTTEPTTTEPTTTTTQPTTTTTEPTTTTTQPTTTVPTTTTTVPTTTTTVPTTTTTVPTTTTTELTTTTTELTTTELTTTTTVPTTTTTEPTTTTTELTTTELTTTTTEPTTTTTELTTTELTTTTTEPTTTTTVPTTTGATTTPTTTPTPTTIPTTTPTTTPTTIPTTTPTTTPTTIPTTTPTTKGTSPPVTTPPPETEHTTDIPGSRHVIGLRVGLSSLASLTEEDIENIVLPQLKEELVKLGLPADIILKLTNVIKDKE